MRTEIFNSYAEFEKREDKTVNGVSPEFARDNPEFARDNSANTGCWNCYLCAGCTDCEDGVGCIGCTDCRECTSCVRCVDCRRSFLCRNSSGLFGDLALVGVKR